MNEFKDRDKPIKQSELDEFFEWLRFVNKDKAIEFYELVYRLEYNGKECYCCTCEYNKDNVIVFSDMSCRMHGAHGKRGCVKHKQPVINCDCGCDTKIKEEADEKR